MKRLFGAALASAALGLSAHADVKLPAIFGDHMVLQQKQADKVWGTADPGEEVTVTFAGQTKTAKAGDDKKWSVALDPMPANAAPQAMTVKGKNTVTFEDVLVGEVWICSGQSNMQWDVQISTDADLESLTAKFPQIRLISVPQVGTQTPKDDFQGKWDLCTPETVKNFSAVGFFFGRQLHQTLGVPVGLIDDAWGGSAAEAWVRRDVLEKDGKYQELLDSWKGRESDTGNHQPANIYNGVLKPTIGYGIKGVIWYQGESNAGRAYQYRDLFPLMIQSWRDEWGIGDFPFYWVQLADFMAEKPEPGDSAWAELREAQTMTMSKLANTGQAVIIDIGEAFDIHPRNKLDVGKRLARWALNRDYGMSSIPCQSPTYRTMEIKNGHSIIKFDHSGNGGLYGFDSPQDKGMAQVLKGFTIAGADKKFVNAKAKIVAADTVEVWSDDVKEPVAVRYAWADNPVVNLYSRGGLPATPFRTDDWPGVTVNNKK